MLSKRHAYYKYTSTQIPVEIFDDELRSPHVSWRVIHLGEYKYSSKRSFFPGIVNTANEGILLTRISFGVSIGW